MTASVYMIQGIDVIEEAFDCGYLTKEHIELCKALLPAYMQASSHDYQVSMEHCNPKGQ